MFTVLFTEEIRGEEGINEKEKFDTDCTDRQSKLYKNKLFCAGRKNTNGEPVIHLRQYCTNFSIRKSLI